MEKEHTPAKIQPNETAFRFSQEEVIHALVAYAFNRYGAIVPNGNRSVRVQDVVEERWALILGVDHHDPPPARKDVKDG